MSTKTQGSKPLAVGDPSIRIGTLVSAGMDSPRYIQQILPHGFESFSLTFWKTVAGIDFAKLADQTLATLDGSGAIVSSLAVFGNPLESGEEDVQSLRAFEQAIDAAPLFGCNIVAGFTGRLRGKPLPDSIDRFAAVWQPLCDRAARNNVRIAFENCDMGGTWQSGDWNIAHDPTAWEMMFKAVPADNIGLEWEPCHQMVSLIEPLPQIAEWGKKFFHVHGKDATIRWDLIRKYGIHSSVHEDVAIKRGVQPIPPFTYHRTPGFGDSNWTDIISELRKVGFAGCIDIEGWHDPVYRGDLEMTGQVHALNYLKRCRGGSFVPNPV